MKRSGKYVGEICVLICALLWGIISLFTLPLNEMGFDSMEITFVRSVLSILFIGIYIFIKDKKLFKIALKDLPLFIIVGCCFLFLCSTYTISIEENGSAVAATLQYTSPIWTLIASYFLFKEKITLTKVLCLTGVLGGCVLLALEGDVDLNIGGILIGLLEGFLLASYNIGCKYTSMKYTAETVTFYIFVFSAIGGFFFSKGWNIPSEISANPSSIFYFIGLSLLCTAVAYILYSIAMKKIPAGKVSILAVFEIVFATFAGLIFYSINPGVFGFIGIAITMASLIAMEIFNEKKESVKEKNKKD